MSSKTIKCEITGKLVEKTVKIKDEDFVLLCYGIRYKKIMFMEFKIYVMSYYCHREMLVKAILKDLDSFKEHKKKQTLNVWLSKHPEIIMRIHLDWCRTCTSTQIRDGFRGDWETKMTYLKPDQKQIELKKIDGLVPDSGCAENKKFFIFSTYDADLGKRDLFTEYDGKMVGKIRSKPMAQDFPGLMLLDEFVAGVQKTIHEFLPSFYDDVVKKELKNLKKSLKTDCQTITPEGTPKAVVAGA